MLSPKVMKIIASVFYLCWAGVGFSFALLLGMAGDSGRTNDWFVPALFFLFLGAPVLGVIFSLISFLVPPKMVLLNRCLLLGPIVGALVVLVFLGNHTSETSRENATREEEARKDPSNYWCEDRSGLRFIRGSVYQDYTERGGHYTTLLGKMNGSELELEVLNHKEYVEKAIASPACKNSLGEPVSAKIKSIILKPFKPR